MSKQSANPSQYPLSSAGGRAIPATPYRPERLDSISGAAELDLGADYIGTPSEGDYAGLIICISSAASATVKFYDVAATPGAAGDREFIVLGDQYVQINPPGRYMRCTGGSVTVMRCTRYRDLTTDSQFGRRG